MSYKKVIFENDLNFGRKKGWENQSNIPSNEIQPAKEALNLYSNGCWQIEDCFFGGHMESKYRTISASWHFLFWVSYDGCASAVEPMAMSYFFAQLELGKTIISKADFSLLSLAYCMYSYLDLGVL